MAEIEKLIEKTAFALEGKETQTEEALKQLVAIQAKVLEMAEGPDGGTPYSDHDIEAAVRALQTKFSIRMEIGTIFEAEDYRPWLSGRQGDIDWYYWDRYRKHLLTAKGFPPRVVRTLDDITDKILNHLEDPSKEGAWSRRGLVVGHVQSGKTANYTGLICKAADAGYRVIIVLAGLLNSLRNQTQERIDSDFMGWCTRSSKPIGVSRFETKRRPVCLTTVTEDFNRTTATTQLPLQALNVPIVLVLKKNKHTLEKLHEWLREQNRHDLREFSMLMIDDEADHASVNTNKEDKDPTTINRAIRDLLKLFTRSSYVGYTATPFANIFIDPENEDEMTDGELYRDLFPRDFILSLDPPDNYVGPHRIFTEEADLDQVRPIEDHEDYLPIKHKIDFVPESLPPSLIRAIDCFVIARAIRLLRGQASKHHSMMINVSRFTGVQNFLKGLVNDRVKELRRSVRNYTGLSTDEALKNKLVKSLHSTWEEEFSSLEFNWTEIQGMLKSSLDPVEVISVNRSSGDTLDYNASEFPNGRSVIAVGGLGLSRGLTLEGLLVSYFLRNSIMYDTLMQMGRWFGYRDGYDDICRIFMTDAAAAWYSHIAHATEELRGDFRKMEKLKMTPLDFGLRVRSHPTSLIVTARNKMRRGVAVPHRIALEGRLIETLALSANPKINSDNLDLVDRTIRSLDVDFGEARERIPLGFLWRSIPSEIIQEFVRQFVSPPASFYTYYSEALIEQLRWIENRVAMCDILLKTLKPSEDDPPLEIGENLYGRLQSREKTAHLGDGIISFKKKSRLGEPRDEEAGLSEDQIEKLQKLEGRKTINPRLYRTVDGRKPLLIVHLIRLQEPFDLACGYGLSFPGDSTKRRPEKLVEYVVNVPYWKKNFSELSEDDDWEEDS